MALPGAASPTWVWQAAGYSSNGFGIAADGSGNVYCTGMFTGDVNFSQDTLENPTRGSSRADMFVASCVPSQGLRWVQLVAGSGNDAGLHIAAGRSGVYVAGYFQSPLSFGGHRLPSAPGRSMFIAKYDFTGTVLWVRAAGDAETMGPEGLAVDADDNAYVFGYFKEYADFGTVRLEKNMAKNLFLARYTANGRLDWARPVTGGDGFISGPWARGVAVAPDGTILVTGTTSGSNRFGKVPHVTAATRYGSKSLFNKEIFIARYSATGEVMEVKSVASFADVEDIAVDGEGNIFLAGAFKGEASGAQQGVARFAGRPLAVTRSDRNRTDNADIFLAKYDRNGDLLWVRSAGGTGDDSGLAVAVDRRGNASVTGLFYGTATFGARSLTVNGGHALKADMFLATYASDGTLLALEQGGGDGNDHGDDIAVGHDGTRYVTGFFSGTTPHFGTRKLRAGPRSLLFVAGYPPVGS